MTSRRLEFRQKVATHLVWQKLVNSMEEEVGGESMSTRQARRSDIQQSKEARKSDILLEKKYNCGMCTSPVADDGIQCGDCRLWFHYICSKLPPYQLSIYMRNLIKNIHVKVVQTWTKTLTENLGR